MCIFKLASVSYSRRIGRTKLQFQRLNLYGTGALGILKPYYLLVSKAVGDRRPKPLGLGVLVNSESLYLLKVELISATRLPVPFNA